MSHLKQLKNRLMTNPHLRGLYEQEKVTYQSWTPFSSGEPDAEEWVFEIRDCYPRHFWYGRYKDWRGHEEPSTHWMRAPAPPPGFTDAEEPEDTTFFPAIDKNMEKWTIEELLDAAYTTTDSVKRRSMIEQVAARFGNKLTNIDPLA